MAHSPTLSTSTVATWLGNISDGVNDSGKLLPYMVERVHVQSSNRKTGAMGEGTAAVVTCIHKRADFSHLTAADVEWLITRGVIPPCARSCYAFREMIQYPAYRAAMIRNTQARRADRVAYYRDFVAAANATDEKRLRVNESGDFETRADVEALFAAAREFQSVTIWGYTQRPAEWIENAPENVTIRVSCWTDAKRAADLERRGYRTAVVDETETTCPAQAAMRYNKAHGLKAGMTGYRVWHCADCAANGAGCCSRMARVTFAKH